MGKFLVFDTETTGLPTSFSAPITDVNNWPRITQLAYMVCDEETGQPEYSACELIYPDGWVIPPTEFHLKHGHLQENNEKNGVPMQDMLRSFCAAYDECDTLVSHNLSFDKPILECEMYRYKIKPTKKLEKFCTKLESEYICKIPSPYGKKYKWPSLEEAHQFFFGTSFEGAHDALADVEACRRVYMAIKMHNELI